MMGIGFPELMVILVIIMIIFGAGKLPEIGNAFGKSIKNFKQSMKEAEQEEIAAEEAPASTETASADAATTAENAAGEGAAAENATGEGATAENTAGKGATAENTAGKGQAQAKPAKSAAKTQEEKMIEEAAVEFKEKRIGTIKTPHDGLVQQRDVFTNSLARTPFGRGRDRGVSRDVF